MRSGSIFTAKTFFNHKILNLTSAMQKYIRRGEEEKAIRCVLELSEFYVYDKKGQSILTNLMNRLRIISCEEFSNNNLFLIKFVDNKLNIFKDNIYSDSEQAQCALIDIIKLFTLTNKSRMLSFIRATYEQGIMNNEDYTTYINNKFKKKKINKGDIIKRINLLVKIKHNYEFIYKHLINDENITDLFRYDIKDSDELKKLMNKFIYYFNIKNDLCYFYAFKILKINTGCKRRYRKKNCVYIIWDFLLNIIKNSQKLDIIKLYFIWFNNHKNENWRYLINSIQISLKNINNKILILETTSEELNSIKQNHFKNKEFIIDDYCFDQHTSKGRSLNRSFIYFAEIASKVKNESNLVIPLYKEIYMKIKYATEGEIYKKKYLQNYLKNLYDNEYKILFLRTVKIAYLKHRFLNKSELNKLVILIILKKNIIPNENKKKFIKIINFLIKKIIISKLVIDKVIDFIDTGYEFKIKKKKIPLIKINKKIVDLINNLPHGQKKCGKHKKVVYIDNEYVYKGPYHKLEKSFRNSIKFTQALILIEKVMKIERKLSSILNIDKILYLDSDYYIVSKNIGNKNLLKSENIKIVSSKLESNIKIYPRGIIKRISDLDEALLTTDIKLAILQHLYLRYLLNIGDSGLHNILYREDNSVELIVGNDLEEIRSSDKGDSKLSFLFRKNPSKKELRLFSNLINNIKLFDLNELNQIKGQLTKFNINIKDIIFKIKKYKAAKNLSSD